MTITNEPTRERIRQGRGTYQAPETSQTARREYGRFRPWYETLEAKGSITSDQAMAAREFDMAYHTINDATGVVGSYGNQRWNGTPVGQLDMQGLIGPEWREHCRGKIKAAHNMLEDREWKALISCISTNGSLKDTAILLHIGGSASTMRANAGKLVRQALHELSILWGFSRQFHPPTS